MDYERRLGELGISLSQPARPVAAYVPAVEAGAWVYISGQLPSEGGVVKTTGKLGAEVSVEEGYRAARLCAINALAALKSVTGDLNRVERIVKVTGFVASAPGFTAQPAVINGCSELLKAVFGEAGSHARTSVGVAELPLGAAVEVEMIVQLRAG
ncbi:MAG TPA: LysR family transcriptional regulator [Clostridiales bacterium UBA8153]|nr:LysR family transcriptional regulator [Clostridiales bacterium UBA8153]